MDDASHSTLSPFTLSVTVTNAGGGAAEATTLRYYRSTDSTITSSDTAQGSEAVGALAAAGTSDHDGGITAPSEAGTYYYGACADSVTDESDTTNNCSSSVTVTVSDSEPDLVVIGIDATDNIETGESFRVGVTVTNQGDAQSAATTLRWKQLVDGTTTEIGTDAVRALIRPQGSFKTIRLTLSTPGTSSYWACVDSVAGESDTTNNCSGRVTVTATNHLATGAPAISGTAQVGQTLTADLSGVADVDGLANVSYSYQWISNDGASDTDIAGATDSTYTLVAADQGNTIKVRVSFTDDAANGETLTSAATAAVATRPNNSANGTPAITGTAQVGETLTANTSGIADNDGLTNVFYSFQWISNDGSTDTDIQGATGSTYTLVSSDEGNAIKVRVSFTDDEGNDESLISAVTVVETAPLPDDSGTEVVTDPDEEDKESVESEPVKVEPEQTNNTPLTTETNDDTTSTKTTDVGATEGAQTPTETSTVPPAVSSPQAIDQLFQPLIEGNILELVWWFVERSQKWQSYDPDPQFEAYNSLSTVDLAADPPVVLIVKVNQETVFRGRAMYLGWNYVVMR